MLPRPVGPPPAAVLALPRASSAMSCCDPGGPENPPPGTRVLF